MQRRILLGLVTLVALSTLLWSLKLLDGSRLQHLPLTTPDAPKSKPSESKPKVEDVSKEKTPGKEDSWSWVQSHELTFPIKYASREIHLRPKVGLQRQSVTKLKAPLFPDFITIESSERKEHFTGAVPPLVLDVPVTKKEPVDASHLMFGIQTNIGRLDDSIPQLGRWLKDTGAKLVVVLLESEGVAVNVQQMEALEKKMRGQGFDVALFPAEKGDIFPQRYFSLAGLMYEKRKAETQWVSLIDDDTFFPSMPGLLAMLAQRNATEEHYIGSLSEDWWAVGHYGFMAFGGAGIFLSLPLAKILHENTPECKNDLRTTAGDVTVMDCIYKHSTTKLEPVPALHQVDMDGDLSGFYESGRQYLSLHHWKAGSSWGHVYPMDTMHLVHDACGDCFLQRWQFDDQTLLTNGFSIAMYPQGHLKTSHHEAMDLTNIEHTWNYNMDVRHSLGPVRRRMELGTEKVQYVFLNSTITDKTVRQLYVLKGAEGQSDSVLELSWREIAK